MSRKKEILQEAKKLYRQVGFHSTSMRELAAAVQMESSSLYNYFKSKEEILEIICFEKAEEFMNAINEVNDIYFGGIQKIQLAIRLHTLVIANDINGAYVFQKEWRSLAEDEKNKMIKWRNEYEFQFRKLIETGIEEGVFQYNNVKFGALNILSSLNWITEWYKPDGKLSPDEIANNLSNIVLGGIAKPEYMKQSIGN